MRPIHAVVLTATFILLSIVHGELLPIAGDSTAVWTAIDLLPTENSFSQNTSTGSTSATLLQSEPASSGTKLPITTVSAPAPESAVNNTPSRSDAKQELRGSSQSTRRESASTTVTAAPVDSTPIIPGAIIITSIPEHATITINDVNVGSTPYNVSGFYPGGYDISLQMEGFAVFKKTIELQPGGTAFITGNLQKESGYLHVISVPPNATVSINDTIVGMTPFTSKPLQQGIYSLTIDLPGYLSYSEQLGISPNLTDTLQVSLLSAEKPGLLNTSAFKSTQNMRRIVFGITGLASTAAGILLNSKVSKNLKQEQVALQSYYEAMLTETEYTSRYSAYREITRSTDRYALIRNICYGLGIASGVGFTVSIPF